MRKFLRLYRVFAVQNLKKLMEYRADFLTGLISFLISQSFNILFLGIIFSQIPNLAGWSYNQILFIYGFSLLPQGLDHLLTDNLWMVAYFTVRRGEFDKYLTRPINPLLHVIMEAFQLDAFGELILGIALLCTAAVGLKITISAVNILLFLIAVAVAALIYTDMKIIGAALAFWLKSSGEVLNMFYDMNDFAKYPTSIYNKTVRGIVTYIIPFALTGFYPASYFLTGKDPLFCIGVPVLVSLVLLALAYWVWSRGINAYESAGS